MRRRYPHKLNPVMDLELSEEQRAMIEMADGLAFRHMPDPHVTWADAGHFRWDFMRELSAHGLSGIDLPEDKGGQGLDLIDALLVIIAIGARSPHLSDPVHISNFGAVRQLARFGTDRVRDEVLRPALAGDALVSIGMTEPGGGSALATLRSTAHRDGGDVIVNGSKVFNSTGPEATHVVVWVRFGPEKRDVGSVVVPAATAGFARGAPERYMSGETHCALSFDNCRVPAEYVLVDHDGMRRMMPVFNIERLGNGGRAYAYGLFAQRLATRYMLERETAGGRLADYQGLQWKLADIHVSLESARLLLYVAASQLHDGVPDPLLTAQAKLAANEAGFDAANQALQIHGGYGYTSDSPLDYVFKRTRGWMIAGGSTEILRHRIAHELLKRAEV